MVIRSGGVVQNLDARMGVGVEFTSYNFNKPNPVLHPWPENSVRPKHAAMVR